MGYLNSRVYFADCSQVAIIINIKICGHLGMQIVIYKYYVYYLKKVKTLVFLCLHKGLSIAVRDQLTNLFYVCINLYVK